MGVRDQVAAARKAGEFDREQEGTGARNSSVLKVRRMQFGERRQANYQIAEGLQELVKKAAQKRKVPMALIVEEALLEYLDAVCEICGR